MKTKIIMLVGLLLTTIITYGQDLHPSTDSHWQLVFAENFYGSIINTAKWDFFPAEGSTGRDSSALTNDGSNHIVNDGIVSLVTKRENKNCRVWQGSSLVEKNMPYTSGCLYSKDAFKYGYFEIRSRFPAYTLRPNHSGEGFSPCFWLFPNYSYNTQYRYNEIDIYEIRGKNNKHTCNIHYSDSLHPPLVPYYPCWSLRTEINSPYDFTVNDGNYHTYAGEWNSKNVRFYYDQTIIRECKEDTIFKPQKMIPLNIFITNFAYSGNFQDTIRSYTYMPYNYDIDYVKVYQLRCDNTIVNEIPNVSNYNYTVKKSITLSGATTIPSYTSLILRAKDYILLNPGFEVPLGADLYIMDTQCEAGTIQRNQ